ncbi:MAG: hypothetical protein RL376_39, partial [Verrucomicrobiota bacterium]
LARRVRWVISRFGLTNTNPYRPMILSRSLTAALALAIAAPAGLFAGKPTINDGATRISSNENAFGFTPKALERMKEALDAGNYYNRNDVDDLMKLIAAKEGLEKKNVLTTPGSGPVLLMTAWSYAKPGTNVVTTQMGYSQLVNEFVEHGGDAKYVPLNDKMGYDFKALGKAIDDKTSIVYICNPNNPTGVLADPKELADFVMSVPQDILVFVDEAYLELSDGGLAKNSMSKLVKLRKNLLVSRTFSKGHGMAGLRCGYGLSSPEVLAKLQKFYAGTPSYLAAIAAQEALKDEAFLASNVKNYATVRNYAKKEFDRLGIKYAEPNGAFVYFHAGIKSKELVDKLKAKKILISGSRESGVPEGTFGDWARVSIGNQAEMEVFFGELEKILGKS